MFLPGRSFKETLGGGNVKTSVIRSRRKVGGEGGWGPVFILSLRETPHHSLYNCQGSDPSRGLGPQPWHPLSARGSGNTLAMPGAPRKVYWRRRGRREWPVQTVWGQARARKSVRFDVGVLPCYGPGGLRKEAGWSRCVGLRAAFPKTFVLQGKPMREEGAEGSLRATEGPREVRAFWGTGPPRHLG